jgi:hypothetical protein
VALHAPAAGGAVDEAVQDVGVAGAVRLAGSGALAGQGEVGLGLLVLLGRDQRFVDDVG